jgi:hypothetical protein
MNRIPTNNQIAFALCVGALVFIVNVNLRAESAKDGPVAMDAVVVKGEKTHTLFMGADIAINLDKDLYAVRDVIGSSWVININGQEKVISAKQAPLNLKITPNLKLTENSVTITRFKKAQAYTFDNDPSVKLTRAMSQSGMDNFEAQNVANAARDKLDTMLGNPAASVLVASDQQFGADVLMMTAKYDGAATHPGPEDGSPHISNAVPTATESTIGSNFGNSTVFDTRGLNAAQLQISANNESVQNENGNEVGARLKKTGLDAMEVEFDIVSEKPLFNPYIVTMTKFHAAGGKEGMVQNLVFAEALHPIDARPLHVHLVEGGFPFDFQVVDFQVHIYDRGVEVATNISDKRVELTREEAFDYIKFEYIGAHKNDTLPAVAAMGRLPADLPTRLAAGSYSAPYFVKVNSDGLANGAFADRDCTRQVHDDYLQGVVRDLRFKPALEKGKPVDGVAEVKLGQLAI